MFHHESVGLDQKFSSFQCSCEWRDEKDVNFPAFLNVRRRQVGTLSLEVSFLAERAVDQPDVVMQVCPKRFLEERSG